MANKLTNYLLETGKAIHKNRKVAFELNTREKDCHWSGLHASVTDCTGLLNTYMDH